MRQIVTKEDYRIAMLEWMAEQMGGRLRLEFPDYQETINEFVEALINPLALIDVDRTFVHLLATINMFSSILNACMLKGCTRADHHEFIKELLNIVWDAFDETEKWLHQQGVVPGQSAN